MAVTGGVGTDSFALNDWKALGIQYQSERRFEEAVDALARATREFPNDAESWFALGACYGELRNAPEAILAIKRGLKLNPNVPGPWRTLALNHQRAGDTSNAVLTLRQAVTQVPDAAALWADLAVGLTQARQHEEAIAACRKAVELDAGHHEVWNCLGRNYEQLGRYDEAVRCYRKSATLQDNDAFCWRRLARCYETLDDTDGRIDALEHLAHRSPPSEAGPWVEFGHALREVGESDRAVEAYSTGVAANPKDVDALMHLASAISDEGYVTDAVELCGKVLALRPGHSDATAEIARVDAGTRHAFERARKSQPDAIRVPAYGEYLNPFELLNCTVGSLAAWDEAELRRQKKRLLAELDLNDGRVPWLGDAELDESRVRQVLDDLDSAEKRYFHHIVCMHRPLLRFLTHGSLAFFAPSPPSVEAVILPLHDHEFLEFLGKPFVRQYDRALARSVKAFDGPLTRALLLRRLPIPPTHHDDCYAATYEFLRQVAMGLMEKADEVGQSPKHASGSTSDD